MILDRLTVCVLFEINSPQWNGNAKRREVGLNINRIQKHNEIHFTGRRKDGQLYYPDAFYFDGDKVNNYPTQKLPSGVVLVKVPLEELEPLQRGAEIKEPVLAQERLF